MAFKQQATLLGVGRRFEVNPEAKPYTLRDNGFVNTKSGNFLYERALDSTHRAGLVLKVMVDRHLQGIQISTVNNKGYSTVDVTKLNNNDMLLEKINFIFDGFVERNCLTEIK